MRIQWYLPSRPAGIGSPKILVVSHTGRNGQYERHPYVSHTGHNGQPVCKLSRIPVAGMRGTAVLCILVNNKITIDKKIPGDFYKSEMKLVN